MDGVNLVLLIIGVYFLISSYLVLKKHKLFSLIFGHTYFNAIKIRDRSKLEKDLGKGALIFGGFLTCSSIILNFYYFILLEAIAFNCIPIYGISLYIIIKRIDKGYYD